MEQKTPTRRYAKYLLKRTDQMTAAFGMLTWLAAYHMARDQVRPAWFDNRWGFTSGYTAVMTNDARFALGGGRVRLDLANLTPQKREEVMAYCKERADWFEERVDDARVTKMIHDMFGEDIEDIEEVFCRTEQTLCRDASEMKRQKRVRKRATTKRPRRKPVAPIEPTPWE